VRILATYNIKGGVGKTATAVNLAYLAARAGERVLIWDLDPQGAATFYFRVKAKRKGGRKLVAGKRALDEAIKATDFDNLDLVPADFSFRNLDLLLDDAKRPERRLAKLLKPLAEDYDRAFLDCPPSISLASESVFAAADALIVPLIPTTLSLRTYDQLLAFAGERALDRLRILPFFCMADRRKRLHREIVDAALADRPEFLKTVVPYASDVERMGVERRPLPAFAPRSPATAAFAALWAEIVAAVG
jgi:chromosome partitioning protein